MDGASHRSSSNPFKGVNVKGKWLVILPGSPDALTPSDLARMSADVNFVQPEANGRELGAIGIVKLPSSYDLNHWDRDKDRETSRGELVVDRLTPQVAKLPQITAGSRLIEALFAGERENGTQMSSRAARREAGDSFALDPSKILSIDVPTVVTIEHTVNVVGIVEGTDPALKSEYVALGAHLDHLGRTSESGGRPRNGDDINNGADNDGSGVVALVTMAGAVEGSAPEAVAAVRLAHGRRIWELGRPILRQFPHRPDRSHRRAAERGHDRPRPAFRRFEPGRQAADGADRGVSRGVAAAQSRSGRHLRRRERRLPAPEVQLQVRRARRSREDLHA